MSHDGAPSRAHQICRRADPATLHRVELTLTDERVKRVVERLFVLVVDRAFVDWPVGELVRYAFEEDRDMYGDPFCPGEPQGLLRA
jgi:hypothetical protein